jgi:hypothetical protein
VAFSQIDAAGRDAHRKQVKTCIVCGWSGEWPECQSCDDASWLVDAEESPELIGDLGLARRTEPEEEDATEAW